MKIVLIEKKISLDRLKEIADEGFGNMVKGVVDIEKNILTLGGELHADEEIFMLEKSSKQENLWGINIYPEIIGSERIEFDSMINVRPRQNNRTRGVEDLEIQKKIIKIVNNLIEE